MMMVKHHPMVVLLNKSNVNAIDLATIVLNQLGIYPVLINGKPIKSLNHRFNKDKVILQSAGESKHIRAIT